VRFRVRGGKLYGEDREIVGQALADLLETLEMDFETYEALLRREGRIFLSRLWQGH
jgi:hypothetical protein